MATEQGGRQGASLGAQLQAAVQLLEGTMPGVTAEQAHRVSPAGPGRSGPTTPTW